MSEPGCLEERLRRLADRPVDPDLAGRHLTAMTAGTSRPRPAPASRFQRARVGAALAAGLVLGGTSLASAGALGAGPQRIVADTVDGVGIDLPGGTPRSTVGCEGQQVRNHGQFVSRGGDPHSDCGKPLASRHREVEADEGGGLPPAAPACRPPWAGRGNHAEKTPEAVAAHEAACGGDDPAGGATEPVEPAPPGRARGTRPPDETPDRPPGGDRPNPSDRGATKPGPSDDAGPDEPSGSDASPEQPGPSDRGPGDAAGQGEDDQSAPAGSGPPPATG